MQIVVKRIVGVQDNHDSYAKDHNVIVLSNDTIQEVMYKTGLRQGRGGVLYFGRNQLELERTCSYYGITEGSRLNFGVSGQRRRRRLAPLARLDRAERRL